VFVMIRGSGVQSNNQDLFCSIGVNCLAEWGLVLGQ